MRKIILVLTAVGLLSLARADLVSAASTADITVTVTCRLISVGVTPSSYAFGTVNELSETVASTSIGISNNGNVNEDFELKLTNPAGWTAIQSGTPSTDQFICGGIFKSTAATTADYVDSEDMISTSYVEATANIFALNSGDAGEKGYSVAAAGSRYLWLYFFAPSLTTVSTQQSITVTIRASAS
jgi:hypothetical protein